MASAPATTVVVLTTTGQRMSMPGTYYVPGSDAYTPSYPPTIADNGLMGAVTGSLNPYRSPAQILWKNLDNDVLDTWAFTNTANRDDALALVDAGLLAGTALIEITPSS